MTGTTTMAQTRGNRRLVKLLLQDLLLIGHPSLGYITRERASGIHTFHP